MKGEMVEVLTEAYMSSEESDQDEGSLFMWERDRIHKKYQSKRSQDRAVKCVTKKGAQSLLDRPEDCTNWASVSDTDAFQV